MIEKGCQSLAPLVDAMAAVVVDMTADCLSFEFEAIFENATTEGPSRPNKKKSTYCARDACGCALEMGYRAPR